MPKKTSQKGETMITYKFFYVNEGEFYPMTSTIRCEFEPYPVDYIVQRAKNCGPFATFKDVISADFFRRRYGWYDCELYKVKIKKSKAKTMWMENSYNTDETYRELFIGTIPNGTILADEFEILEQVK